MDYAEQTALIAMRAKLALVNRQIKELSQAKKTIALDHSSANAQLILAEARLRLRLIPFFYSQGVLRIDSSCPKFFLVGQYLL